MARTTDYAILGILTQGAQSGYDIKKRIGESIGYFWQESYGQLYPSLKNMVQENLVTMQVKRNEGKPDKKIYRITLKGKDELKKWLEEPVKSVPKIRHELLLKLFFGIETTTQVNLKHVVEYKDKCGVYLKQLKQVNRTIKLIKHFNPSSMYWLITLSSGIHTLNAEIAWCEETIKTLSRKIK